MQPLPYEQKLLLQEFVMMPCIESLYKLRSFNFILGSTSDSASGYRYRRNTKTGTLTSVHESVCVGEKFYTQKTFIETKIENPKEFEKEVYEILSKYALDTPDMCSAISTFKLRCLNKKDNEIVNVIEATSLPKWYEPLCAYLDTYFNDYHN